MAKFDEGRSQGGHYDFCSLRVSPEGHRPASYCHLRVWWHDRTPLGWKTRKAVDTDQRTPHSCRDWSPADDADYRREVEFVSRERHFNGGWAERIPPGGMLLMEEWSPSPSTAKAARRAERIRNAEPEPKRAARPQREPSGPRVMRGDRVALAVVRTARKAHPCKGGCDQGIPERASYVSSQEDGAGLMTPDRYCLGCAGRAGFSVETSVS